MRSHARDVIKNAIFEMYRSLNWSVTQISLDLGGGNLLNIILDAIFIFFIGLGIDGAALATVISEYVNDVVKSMIIFSFRDVRFLEYL